MSAEEIKENTPGDDAPTWIDASLIEKALRRVGDGDNIHVVSVTISRATAPGDNYGSILYRVKATLSAGAGEHSLLVKVMPKGSALASALSESRHFPTEIAMLTKYVPVMQAELDRVAPNRFSTFAALCPLHDSTSQRYLILEDLKTQGYRLAERHRGLGLRHCLLALRSLARFHAASAKILKEDPSIMSALPNCYRENRSNFYEPFITSSIQIAADALRKWSDFHEYADTLDRFKQKIMDLLVEMHDPVPGGFNVIAHGDFWNNNMMYKYDENGLPIDIRFVDFQISHVTSPANDVLNLLCTSVNDEVLKKHEQLLLREYHVALIEATDLLGIQGPSHDEFTADINKHSPCSIFYAVVVWPMVRSVQELDLDSSVKGESGPGSITNLYEKDVTKRWWQYILPEYKNRGWLKY